MGVATWTYIALKSIYLLIFEIFAEKIIEPLAIGGQAIFWRGRYKCLFTLLIWTLHGIYDILVTMVFVLYTILNLIFGSITRSSIQYAKFAINESVSFIPFFYHDLAVGFIFTTTIFISQGLLSRGNQFAALFWIIVALVILAQTKSVYQNLWSYKLPLYSQILSFGVTTSQIIEPYTSKVLDIVCPYIDKYILGVKQEESEKKSGGTDFFDTPLEGYSIFGWTFWHVINFVLTWTSPAWRNLKKEVAAYSDDDDETASGSISTTSSFDDLTATPPLVTRANTEETVELSTPEDVYPNPFDQSPLSSCKEITLHHSETSSGVAKVLITTPTKSKVSRTIYPRRKIPFELMMTPVVIENKEVCPSTPTLNAISSPLEPSPFILDSPRSILKSRESSPNVSRSVSFDEMDQIKEFHRDDQEWLSLFNRLPTSGFNSIADDLALYDSLDEPVDIKEGWFKRLINWIKALFGN